MKTCIECGKETRSTWISLCDCCGCAGHFGDKPVVLSSGVSLTIEEAIEAIETAERYVDIATGFDLNMRDFEAATKWTETYFPITKP